MRTFTIITLAELHCSSTDLWKLALLVDERHDVQLLDGDQVQGILVVHELYVLPVDVLQVVLLLFQLEDMLDKKLLQILIGVVDAELLKTGTSIKSAVEETTKEEVLCFNK